MPRDDRVTERWLFFLLALTFAWFFQSGQHNEAARFDLVRALVELGQVQIDPFAHNSADIIRYRDGHYYSNKAPGTSLIAVPPFYLLGMGLDSLGLSQGLRYHLLCWLTTVATIGLSSALGAVLLFRLLRRLGGSPGNALFLTLAMALGTIAFPFSTLFFSHQLAAVLLFAGFYSAYAYAEDDHADGSRRPLGWLALGGAALGFAVVTEYPAAFAVLLIHGYAVVRLARCGRGRAWLAFAGASVVGALPLVLYNLAAFGVVWYTPLEEYASGAAGSFEAHKLGFLGLQNPLTNPDFTTALRAITVGSQRGLLYCNPILALAIPGLVVGLARRRRRLELALVVAMTSVFLTLNASYGDSMFYWGGGNSIGPRYLIVCLPFLAIPLFEAATVRPLRWLAYLLAPVSIVFMLAATAVEPRAPLEYRDPIRQLALPHFLAGDLALCADGIFSSELITGSSIAFNLGGASGLPRRWQLAPLYAIWALGLLALGRGPLRGAAGSRPMAAAPYAALALLTAAPPLLGLLSERPPADGSGLLGRYYASGDFQGSPRFVRFDPVVHFDWSEARPFPGHFSVVWQGRLRIDRPGRYHFATASDDASWLYIDGELVVDNSGAHGLRRREGSVELEPGPHLIVVRYADYGFGAIMRLTWRPPGEQIEALIPRQVLDSGFLADDGPE